MYDTTTGERRTLPAHHEGAVQCLALIDVLHHPSYHNGLQHHALVTGGASEDNNIILSVLLDQFGTDISREQEVKLRRHSQGIAAISVLSTNMAVLGQDSRVSLWVLGTPINTDTYEIFFKLKINI